MGTRVANSEELFGGLVGGKDHFLILKILIRFGLKFLVFISNRSLGRRAGGDGGGGGGREGVFLVVEKRESSELASEKAIEVGGERKVGGDGV